MKTERKFVLFLVLPCLFENPIAAFQISKPLECEDDNICIIQSTLISPVCVGGFCVPRADLHMDVWICTYSNATLPSRRILVHVDDSLSGKGLEKASVTYQCLNGSTTLQGMEVTRENGLANLTVSPDCSEMKVVVISDGYAEGQAIVPINHDDLEAHPDLGDGKENERRDTEINLSLAPKHFGKDVIIRAVLNWASYRRDLDLHVVAFDPKGQVSCHVSHSKKYCPHMSLDRDNTKTGDHGSETISFTRGSAKKYLVYVKVYPEYRYLYNSGARITLYSVGSITKPVTLSGVTENDKQRVWLVGCFLGSLGLKSWTEINLPLHRIPINSDCNPIT
ncbi:uncharacterized protein LOC131880463 [Tigriopus californicus]|uniref:uncharacterized protein LOC131880463 n=1 Tax=Tigriopus californicus TaxID=6832 RepID=UPI0027DA7067|nr:uncharacterized protein LOC131880463 [Tigriopus californicus]